MLKVVKPELEDLWFRESMMADIETMSYNDAWGGTTVSYTHLTLPTKLEV